LEKSVSVYEKILKVAPDSMEYRLKLAKIYLKNNEALKANELLSSIEIEEINFDHDHLVRLENDFALSKVKNEETTNSP
jgi:hypothetical protein